MAIGIGSSFNEDNEYDGPLIGSSMRDGANYYTSEDSDRLYQAKKLLKESLSFMNKVPNKKYGNNYKLCSLIEKFLKK